MSKISEQFERHGDKENSKFFEDYLQKIYDEREKMGLDDLFQKMRGIVVQVAAGEAIKYLMELYLMTPYRFRVGYENATHKVYVLQVKPEFPFMFILEPKAADYFDNFTAANSLFLRAAEKPNVRYIGEIYQVKNLKETVEVLKIPGVRMQPKEVLKNQFLANENFRVSEISYFTNNVVIYTEKDLNDLDALGLGEIFGLGNDIEQLEQVNKVHEDLELHKLIRGIDHMATRVFSGAREDAILELLVMTNYYFWGSYNIDDMNSSTNISRSPGLPDELLSPAKVFTANNTPFYVGHIDKLPSPTEDFVRNFGRRMHHIAYEVIDGERPDKMKNIDYVVSKLHEENIPFLAQVIGECKDFPDLKQIFSKSSNYSFLITEYVQRCQGFAGFFTKTNVAALTAAAGEDEKLKESGVSD